MPPSLPRGCWGRRCCHMGSLQPQTGKSYRYAMLLHVYKHVYVCVGGGQYVVLPVKGMLGVEVLAQGIGHRNKETKP